MQEDTSIQDNTQESLTDDQEWAEVFDEFAEDRGEEITPSEPDTTDSSENSEDSEESLPEGDDKSADADEGDSEGEGDSEDSQQSPDETPKQEEPQEAPVLEKPELTTREALKQIEAEQKEIESEVAQELYGGEEIVLKDGDGDPINSVQDVMQLTNPDTDRAFTEEEATIWFMQAQNYIAQQSSERSREVSRISEINSEIKDEAEGVLKDYSRIFDKNPGLKERLWNDWSSNLKLKGNLIVEKPEISIRQFYDVALRGYVESADKEAQARQAEANRVAEAEAKAKEAEARAREIEQKAKAEVDRARNRNDREDILTTSNNVDSRTKDQKEWDDVINEYYEEN